MRSLSTGLSKMRAAAEQPVGIFDSGVGGLSAAYQLERILQAESYVYFRDTARLPYGTRTVEAIRKYSLQDAHFLMSKAVKAILVACGTASSNALGLLSERLDVPVVGVIEGAVDRAYAIAQAGGGKVAILGTAATIKSGAFERALREKDKALRILPRACPMFVPLVENGYTAPDDRVAELIAREYLSDIAAERPDAVILGCTHYPLLSGVIGNILQDSVLVNSSIEAVLRIRDVLHACGLCAPPCAGGADARRMFYVRDDIDGFTENAHRFLGRNIRAELVDIDRY